MSNLSVNVAWQEYMRLLKAGKFSQSQAITAPLKYHAEIIETTAKILLGGYRASHPDILTIGTSEKPPLIGDAQKGNYEGTCRWLQENILLKPIESPKRLCVINSADKLNANAANSLLKLTEEPPSYAYILYLMTDGKLLPTLRSRVTMTVITDEDEIEPSLMPLDQYEWLQWFKEARQLTTTPEKIADDLSSWIKRVITEGEEGLYLAEKFENLRVIISRKNLAVPLICDMILMQMLEDDGKIERIFNDIRKA